MNGNGSSLTPEILSLSTMTPVVQRELADLSNTLPSSVLQESKGDILIPIQTAVPAFDILSPPPMLPPQPGDVSVDVNGQPCTVSGLNPLDAMGNPTGTIDSMVGFQNFVEDNFNMIVLVLLAILVLRNGGK